MENTGNYWSAKHDAFRPHTDFMDLLKIVSTYYEMYERAAAFVGPWIAKQSSTIFIPPDKDQLKAALGREKPGMCWKARAAFIDAVINYTLANRGRKTLITPNPSTHHSAQFPSGTFEISACENDIKLSGDHGLTSWSGCYKIEFSGAQEPVYIKNLKIPPHQVKFIILRPRMGKLGTASVSKWEVLLFKKPHAWLVEHTDSSHNPRFSGII